MAAGSGLTATADASLTRTIVGVTSGAYSTPANNYVALYTNNMTASTKSPTTGVEWLASSDTNYARQAMGATGTGWTIAAYANGTGVVWNNSNTITQPAVAGTLQTLGSVGFCDALTAGNVDFFADLSTPVSVAVGVQVILSATTGAVFTTY